MPVECWARASALRWRVTTASEPPFAPNSRWRIFDHGGERRVRSEVAGLDAIGVGDLDAPPEVFGVAIFVPYGPCQRFECERCWRVRDGDCRSCHGKVGEDDVEIDGGAGSAEGVGEAGDLGGHYVADMHGVTDTRGVAGNEEINRCCSTVGEAPFPPGPGGLSVAVFLDCGDE